MRILLAGPKLCSPWSEGRKRFARDLAAELADRHGHEVRVITTVQQGEATAFPVPWRAPAAVTGVGHLARFHAALANGVAGWRPDLVCHVPIGSFHGRYRYGNLASMWLAERQCRLRDIPCYTLMYAIVQEASVAMLRRRVRHLLVNQYTGGAERIRFGLALPPAPPPAPGDGRSLLFLAGMAEATPERLDHVLRLRGLATLLRAGRRLAAAGFRLTAAAPLLADPALRERLLTGPDNTWPRDRLRLLGMVEVPAIYGGHDFLVFPYGRDEVQFVPNSVIEAMRYGLATVLPRLPFLAPLLDNGACAYGFRPGDTDDLATVLIAAAADPEGGAQRRQAAVALVEREFAIAGTVADLLAYHARQTDGSN